MSPHDDFVCCLGFVLILVILALAPFYVFLACSICGFTLGILREKRNPPKDIWMFALLSVGIGFFGEFIARIPLGSLQAIRFACTMSLLFYFFGYGFGRWTLAKKFKYAQIDRMIRQIDERREAFLKENYMLRIDGRNHGYSLVIVANEREIEHLYHRRERLASRRARYA